MERNDAQPSTVPDPGRAARGRLGGRRPPGNGPACGRGGDPPHERRGTSEVHLARWAGLASVRRPSRRLPPLGEQGVHPRCERHEVGEALGLLVRPSARAGLPPGRARRFMASPEWSPRGPELAAPARPAGACGERRPARRDSHALPRVSDLGERRAGPRPGRSAQAGRAEAAGRPLGRRAVGMVRRISDRPLPQGLTPEPGRARGPPLHGDRGRLRPALRQSRRRRDRCARDLQRAKLPRVAAGRSGRVDRADDPHGHGALGRLGRDADPRPRRPPTSPTRPRATRAG